MNDLSSAREAAARYEELLRVRFPSVSVRVDTESFAPGDWLPLDVHGVPDDRYDEFCEYQVHALAADAAARGLPPAGLSAIAVKDTRAHESELATPRSVVTPTSSRPHDTD